MAEQPIDKDGFIKAGAINSIIEEFDKWKKKLEEIDVLIDKLGKSTPIVQPPKNTEDLNKLLTKIEKLEDALKKKSETETKLSAIEKERVNINKQVIGTLKESNTEWRSQTSNMQENAKALQENKRELKSVQAEIKRLNGEIETYGKFKAQSQENADAVKQMNDRVTQLTAEEAKLKVNISQTNIMLKTQAKEMLAVDGSMDKANHTLGQMRKLWRQMSAEEKNSPFGKQLLGEIEALDTGLKSADAEIGNFQRGVGNYKGAILEAFNSTGLFGAEMGKITTLLGGLTSSMPRVVSRLGGLDKTVGKLGKGVGGLSTSFRGLGTAFKALPIIGWISLIAEAVSWVVELTSATKEQTEATKEQEEAERKANDEIERGNKLRIDRANIGKNIETQLKNLNDLSQAELKILKQNVEARRSQAEANILNLKTAQDRLKADKEELDSMKAGTTTIDGFREGMFNLSDSKKNYNDEINKGIFSLKEEQRILKESEEQLVKITSLIKDENKIREKATETTRKQNKVLEDQLKAYQSLIDLQDELWFRNLGDEDQEVVKRMQQLDAEMAKIEADTMMRAENREALRKALINDSEKDIQAIRDKFAKERIDKENEAIKLEKERIEQARLDEIQGLEEQALLAKEVRTNELLQSKLSKDEFDKQSLDSEIKYLEEMIQIRKDAGIETIDLENQLLALRKNANNKANQEFLNSVASSVTLLKDLYSDEIDFAISKQNELIANSQKTIDNIKAAAMAGNIQAKESILAEEKAIEESQKRIEQAQKRKQRMEFISSGINAFNSSVQSGKTGLQALGDTAVTMSGLAGMLAGLLPSFDVGADRLTGDGRGVDGKGGFLAINHPDERIITAEQNAIIGYHHKNSDIANVMSFYNKGLLRPAHEIGAVVTYDNSEVLDRIDKGFSKINNWNISTEELFGTISVLIDKSKNGNIHRSKRNFKA